MVKRSISISSIGTEIRKKQKELRAAKSGRTKAEQKKIELTIKALDKQFNAVKSRCAGWKAI